MAIDYQKIIEELEDDKVMQLLDDLDIPYENKEDYLLMPTVCHNDNSEDASWKLYYYKNSHMFMCYTECQNMSIFQFLENFYKTRNIEYEWKKDILQVVLNCSAAALQATNNRYHSIKDVYAHTQQKELEKYNKGVLEVFSKYYAPEWLSDGISSSTMDKFDIRYSISQNKIIIPHFDYEGNLIGIRGRALNEQEIEIIGKYMPVQIEGKWYSHPLSLNLYGLNFTKNNIKEKRIAWICESEKAVMQCENFCLDNCAVAICGSHLNKFQIKLLAKICQPYEVVLCMDKDKQDFDELWKTCNNYNNLFKMSFIYDRNNLLGEKDSPTDLGEEVFRELLDERIKI